jgi:hypothetical protein
MKKAQGKAIRIKQIKPDIVLPPVVPTSVVFLESASTEPKNYLYVMFRVIIVAGLVWGLWLILSAKP